MDFSMLCRCCLREFSQETPMCSNKMIMEMYLFCIQLNYKFVQGEEAPKYFCSKCRDKLKSTYLFIRHAKRCNERLQKAILQKRATEDPYLDSKSTNTEGCNSNIEMNMDFCTDTENSSLQDDKDTMLVIKDSQRITGKPEIHDILYLPSSNHCSDTSEHNGKEDKNIDTTQFIKILPKLGESTNNKRFKSKESLSSHMVIHIKEQSEGNDERPFVCAVCEKRFKKRKHLTTHAVTHSDHKPFQCDLCQRTFKLKRSMWTHMKIHKMKQTGERPYACDVCNKRFHSRNGLKVHATIHSEHRPRPFSCHLCQKSFMMKQSLVKHIETHNDSYPSLCTVCGKRFKNESYLSAHMQRHTGIKSHACGLCSYRAAYSSSLRRHEATHANKRQHKCPHCQKMFNGRAGLVRHIRIHTGEKPIQCPSCPLRFIDHSKRKTHLMRVHKVPFNEIPRLSADGRPILD